MEYIEGGELFQHLIKNGRMEEKEAIVCFRQIVSGLYYCQLINICHRDLKPENILFTANGVIKIADFGLAALCPKGHMLQTACGSPHYAAPEVVNGLVYDGRKSDVWSCGVVLFTLLAGRTPFDGENLSQLLKKVREGHYVMPDISPLAQDLVRKMICVDPEKRIKMSDVLKHPLLVKYAPHCPITGEEVRVLAAPVGLEDVVGPVISTMDDIDPETMKNLHILHHEKTQEQLIDLLLSDRLVNR
jgi:serine/threonine protein kinase